LWDLSVGSSSDLMLWPSFMHSKACENFKSITFETEN
jgi:hypothetical protein